MQWIMIICNFFAVVFSYSRYTLYTYFYIECIHTHANQPTVSSSSVINSYWLTMIYRDMRLDVKEVETKGKKIRCRIRNAFDAIFHLSFFLTLFICTSQISYHDNSLTRVLCVSLFLSSVYPCIAFSKAEKKKSYFIAWMCIWVRLDTWAQSTEHRVRVGWHERHSSQL